MRKPLFVTIASICLLLLAFIIYFGVFAGGKSHQVTYTWSSEESYHGQWEQNDSLHGSKITFNNYLGKDSWSFKVKKGDKVKLDYDIDISEGSLSISVENSLKNEVIHIETQGKCQGSDEVTSSETATWSVVTRGDTAKGNLSFNIR